MFNEEKKFHVCQVLLISSIESKGTESFYDSWRKFEKRKSRVEKAEKAYS